MLATSIHTHVWAKYHGRLDSLDLIGNLFSKITTLNCKPVGCGANNPNR